jgi:short-subunit dehydrogenase involved in D-alanine esterification of teichoic acids
MENQESGKYKIEFINEAGEVSRVEHSNNLKNFAQKYNLNYYAVRSIVNNAHLDKKRKMQKYGQELSKRILITENQDYNMDFKNLV